VTPFNESAALAGFIAEHPDLTVLTGAGCSTASGIPEYRDDDGEWMHARPVQYPDFVASPDVRRRYWARSYVGWQTMSRARPNESHRALAELQRLGYVRQLITQNVDDLHSAAGSTGVIDLHGVLRVVRCLDCDRRLPREDMQRILEARNGDWAASIVGLRPDGDAQIDAGAVAEFDVPDCGNCGGILKPDVVFFGENVPRERVARCEAALAESRALLVVGSSLMVFSGFRFARDAADLGKPVAIVNRGRTRADELATLKCSGDCGELLQGALAELQRQSA